MPGAERLRESEKLKELLAQQKLSSRFYAAVCASPGTAVLAHRGHVHV